MNVLLQKLTDILPPFQDGEKACAKGGREGGREGGKEAVVP